MSRSAAAAAAAADDCRHGHANGSGMRNGRTRSQRGSRPGCGREDLEMWMSSLLGVDLAIENDPSWRRKISEGLCSSYLVNPSFF